MSDEIDLTSESSVIDKCSCCLEEFLPEDVHKLDCDDTYCNECIRAFFLISFKSEDSFPPNCCKKPIVITPRLIRTLGKEIWSEYIAKRAEFKDGSRVYCSNKDCGAFISEDYKFPGFAICGKCDTFTCTKCRGPCHEGECPPQEGSAELEKLAKEEGWIECYRCGNMIEKTDGCNHVDCSCGASICYKCKKPLDKCICDGDPLFPWLFDDARQLERLIARPSNVREHNDVVTLQDRSSVLSSWTRPRVRAPPLVPMALRRMLDDEDDQFFLPPEPKGKGKEKEKKKEEKSKPKPKPKPKSKDGCKHHAKKYQIMGVDKCPQCQRRVAKYVLECKKCSFRACWDCFKKTRHVKED